MHAQTEYQQEAVSEYRTGTGDGHILRPSSEDVGSQQAVMQAVLQECSMAHATSSSSTAHEPAQPTVSHTTNKQDTVKTGSNLRAGAAAFAPAAQVSVSTPQQPAGATAAFCGPFVIGGLTLHLQPPASPEHDAVRRENLLAALLHGAEGYGMALLNEEAKLACLSRLTADSLNSILAEPNPEQLLDDLWVTHEQYVHHQAAQSQQCAAYNQHQQHWAPAPEQVRELHDVASTSSASQMSRNYQHQQEASIQQQQQYVGQQPQQQPAPSKLQQQLPPAAVKVLGPKDLDPAAAVAFEAALPAGLLPESWRDLLRWGHLEMHCKFTVCGIDPQAVLDVRNRFTRAKEAAIAATQAARQQTSGSSSVRQAGIPANIELTHNASTLSGVAERVMGVDPCVTTPSSTSTTQQQPSATAGDSAADNLQRSNSNDSSRSHRNVDISSFSAADVMYHPSILSEAEAATRQQQFLEAVGSRVPEYADYLAQHEEKLAALSMIIDADLSRILQQDRPNQALEDVYNYLCITNHTEQAYSSSQEHFQAHTDGQMLPFHVPRQLRGQFVASLPPGFLPETWMTFQSWESLEAKVNLDACGAPYPGRKHDAQIAFWNAVSAITQACQHPDGLQGGPEEQQQAWQVSYWTSPPPQQQQRIRPCDLPAEFAAHFADALPRDMLPCDWQSYDDWRQLQSDLYVRSDVGRQMFKRAKAAVLKDFAAWQAQQNGYWDQHNLHQPSWEHPQQAGQAPVHWNGIAEQPGGTSTTQLQRQHGCRNTVAPCDLPAAVARLLESMIPEGMLPADWQQFESWSDLDVNISFTAGSADTAVIVENTKLYREAKQAALAAAKAASVGVNMQPHGSLPRATASRSANMMTGQQQQQQGSSQGKPSSNGHNRFNSNVNAATAAAQMQRAAPGSNSAAPAVPAAQPSTKLKQGAAASTSPPSVSWLQAAAATASAVETASAKAANTNGQQAMMPVTVTTAPAQESSTPVLLAAVASGDSSEYLSCRSRSDDSTASSSTPRQSRLSSSSGFNSSSNGSTGTNSSNSTAVPQPMALATVCPEPVKPRNKYIAAGRLVCYRCGFAGHLGQQCSTPYCGSCEQWGHADGVDCLSACYRCGRVHKNSGYSCDQPECRECKLVGHKVWECPLTVCKFCGCNGHTDRYCKACGECKQWGHTLDKCPGYCKKCNTAGHRTAECKVKRCAQCGQVGCVVGMCKGTDSSSSGSNRGSSGGGSTAAAVAATAKFNVRNVSFDIALDEQQEEEHRQRLMDRLMSHPKLEQYAYGLLMDTEKLAVLAGVAAADMSLLLQQQDPVQLLEELYAMQALGGGSSQSTASGADPSSSSRLEASNHAEGQVQQQPLQQRCKVIMPCDLLPHHRQMFEGRLPSNSLPVDWWEYTSWRSLEKEHVMSFRDTGVRAVDLRITFRRERQRVQAAAAADFTVGGHAPQGQQYQQQESTCGSNTSWLLDSQQQQHSQGWSEDHGQQQQGRSGWAKAALPQQQQQQTDDDGWPDVCQEDQGGAGVQDHDSWASGKGHSAAAAARTAVSNTAWARQLPDVQQQQVEEHGFHTSHMQPRVYYPAAASAAAVASGMPVYQQQAAHQAGTSGLPVLQPQQQQLPPAAVKVLGPKDLDPAAAVAFEAALPAGLLPESWRDLLRWGHLEMHCKFTVCGIDAQAVLDVRNRFTRAKEAAIAATQAAHAAQLHQQQIMHMQQQYMVAGAMQPHVMLPPAAGHAPLSGTVPPSLIYVVGPDALQQQGAAPGQSKMPLPPTAAGVTPHPAIMQHRMHQQGAGSARRAGVAAAGNDSDAEDISSMMDMLGVNRHQ